MGTQKITVLSLTVKSTGAIVKKRAVTYAGAQAGAAANIIGIADYGATGAGEYVTVDALRRSLHRARLWLWAQLWRRTHRGGSLLSRLAQL